MTDSDTNTANTTVRHDNSLMRRIVNGPAEIGELTVIASRNGLRAVLWNCDNERGRIPIDGPWIDSDEARAILDRTEIQLTEYFAGSRTDFDLPLDPIGTDFQRLAWTALSAIPFGQTQTYGQQAKSLGRSRAARAVGSANGRNPISIIVPCHRVVGSDGSLTGFAGGIETKRFLLEHERRVHSERLDR